MPRFRILELFAGIGGLHWGLKVANIPCEVVTAMEINPTVMQIYSHNFPETEVVSKNLQGITAADINDLDIDAIVMSPPCQPFCRMGNRLDIEDNRTGPLSHLIEILPDVKFKYIFVENVQGFEESMARRKLLESLEKSGFHWREFMLTPKVIQVPNSRLRYYLLGKRKKFKWTFEGDQILTEIPSWNDKDKKMPFTEVKKKQEEESFCRRQRWKERKKMKQEEDDQESLPPCVGDILEWDLSSEEEVSLKLSNSVLKKYYQAMDIVTPKSVNSCCFTKGYGHFVKGTGSVLRLKCDSEKCENCDGNSNNKEGCVDSEDDQDRFSSLRYFSPKEISRLMSYPDEFSFPENLSRGQKYRALGNSVNVYVVAVLFTILFTDE